VSAAGAKRTPIQKHLDCLAFLAPHPEDLTKLTGIAVDRLHIRFALVTDHLVPMQFSWTATASLATS
jgi:hypothetical protein